MHGLSTPAAPRTASRSALQTFPVPLVLTFGAKTSAYRPGHEVSPTASQWRRRSLSRYLMRSAARSGQSTTHAAVRQPTSASGCALSHAVTYSCHCLPRPGDSRSVASNLALADNEVIDIDCKCPESMSRAIVEVANRRQTRVAALRPRCEPLQPRAFAASAGRSSRPSLRATLVPSGAVSLRKERREVSLQRRLRSPRAVVPPQFSPRPRVVHITLPLPRCPLRAVLGVRAHHCIHDEAARQRGGVEAVGTASPCTLHCQSTIQIALM